MSRNNDRSGLSSNRRRFLKTAVGSAAGLASVGTAHARRRGRDRIGTDEVGITSSVREQISEGNPERALELLKANDVKYDHFEAQVSTTSEDEEGQVSAQSVFDNDPSAINFFAYETAAPLYNAEVMWDLTPHASADCLQPNDVAAITYDGSRWQVAGDEWTDYYIEDFYSESAGFFGLWDDEVAYVMNGDTTGNIGATIEKADPYRGNDQNIWAHYEHTWTPPWKGSCAAAQFFGGDVSLSAGAISVATTADSWKIRKDPLSI